MPRISAPKNQPRRVLLLLGEVFAAGGVQRFNRTLLAACGRLDVACDVLTLNDNDSPRGEWTSPASIHVRGFNRNKARFSLAVAAAALFGRYDVIIVGHINLLALTVTALALRRISRPRLLLIAHGIEVWSRIRGTRRGALRAVDSILCVSNYTARAIESQAPEVSGGRCVILPNALGENWTKRVTSSGNIDGARTSTPERFILSVTRLDKSEREKGVIETLEAFAMLDDPSLQYIVAGRGDDQPYLASVATRLRVSDRVHFLGGVSDDELAQLYENCLAFVLPSNKEGFGLVFLEAMFFGAPVIGAAAKGAVDVIQHEGTGLLVPYGNPVALKEALQRILADPTLRDQIRVGGLQTVTGDGRFTFTAYVRRLGAVLGAPTAV